MLKVYTGSKTDQSLKKQNPARAFKCQDPPEEVPEYKCRRTENMEGKMSFSCSDAFVGPCYRPLSKITGLWFAKVQSFYVLFNGPLTVGMGSGIS